MKETVELRVAEEFAPLLFTDDEGELLGKTIRKVVLSTDDQRYHQIGEIADEVSAKYDKSFFHGWIIKRVYSKREMDEAHLFHLLIRGRSVFEPEGEHHGTKYDEAMACPRCGAGAVQLGPLILNTDRIPKGKDFAKTIAGEVIVSTRAVEILKHHEVSGATFAPVQAAGADEPESKGWHQLIIDSVNALVVPPTRTGIKPFEFDEIGEYCCALGDTIGLNLLTELYIDAQTRSNADFVATKQFFGVRRGVLRPERKILVSSRVRELILSENLKGCEFEIAHLV